MLGLGINRSYAAATAAGDTTAPGEVTGLSFQYTSPASATNQVLNWTNPVDVDFSGVLVLRKTTTFTGSDVPVDGTGYNVNDTIGTATVVAKTATTQAQVTGVQTTRYYFKVVTYDTSLNYSTGTLANDRCGLAATSISNGTFDNTSAWTLRTDMAITGGKIVFTNCSDYASQDFSQSATNYFCEFEISDYSGSGLVRIRLSGNNTAYYSSNGVKTETVLAAGFTTNRLDCAVVFNGKVDNVSIRRYL